MSLRRSSRGKQDDLYVTTALSLPRAEQLEQWRSTFEERVDYSNKLKRRPKSVKQKEGAAKKPEEVVQEGGDYSLGSGRSRSASRACQAVLELQNKIG